MGLARIKTGKKVRGSDGGVLPDVLFKIVIKYNEAFNSSGMDMVVMNMNDLSCHLVHSKFFEEVNKEEFFEGAENELLC